MFCWCHSVPVELRCAEEAERGLGWKMGMAMVLGCRSSERRAKSGEEHTNASFPCWAILQGFEVENKRQTAQHCYG